MTEKDRDNLIRMFQREIQFFDDGKDPIDYRRGYIDALNVAKRLVLTVSVSMPVEEPTVS